MAIEYTTQNHLDIEDIKQDYLILKSGKICVVLETNAVNFDLLSELEQDAIISAFSMLLNSLTFPIQVVIKSRKLDITKYIAKVSEREKKIKDPLFRKQAEAYRKFVQDIIQTNEVLDKKFYVVVPHGGRAFESTNANPFNFITKLFGPKKYSTSFNVDEVIKVANRELLPKVEHVVKEFNRIGVKSKRMSTQELVELYFDIYNPSNLHGQRIKTNIEDYQTAIVEPAIMDQ